ncbi:hypothetical protein [Paracoccus aerodenitrificans]|uniref:hypothetical protein n=1 Tax=Paracoccus aerodenitrificans TaxID=3017781 RepID=UPI0022F05CB5|nr:hypothetical protein [Paracoccus aerodenitrificans]WBU64583.1 hypothetical protein PAE61_03825 [Paracoccus aerodenitrificans]
MRVKPIMIAAATASLAACAIPDDRANPDDVILLSDRLTVIFSNGEQCHVEEVSKRLIGDFPSCPVNARYEISFIAPDYFGNRYTEPYADVTITTADGRETLFKTPHSRDPDYMKATNFD